MAWINTVTGPLETSALGFCQPHEHIFTATTPASGKNPALTIDDEERSAEELSDFYSCGGQSMIDCQPYSAGGNPFALRRISASSAVHVVSVTGYHMPAFYPSDHWIFTEDMYALRERFLADLTEGVSALHEDGRIFPGAVKAAIGKEGPDGRFEICLRAAAGAAAAAGVPLILHTETGAGAVSAVSLCEQEGLDPAHIAVCHVDRQATDFTVHEAVAHTNAYLEYDTIARFKYHDDLSEIALIRHMLSLGYEKRLLISLDTTASRLRRYGGFPGIDYILRTFIPMLIQAGVSETEIYSITHLNPERLFDEAAGSRTVTPTVPVY